MAGTANHTRHEPVSRCDAAVLTRKRSLAHAARCSRTHPAARHSRPRVIAGQSRPRADTQHTQVARCSSEVLPRPRLPNYGAPHTSSCHRTVRRLRSRQFVTQVRQTNAQQPPYIRRGALGNSIAAGPHTTAARSSSRRRDTSTSVGLRRDRSSEVQEMSRIHQPFHAVQGWRQQDGM